MHGHVCNLCNTALHVFEWDNESSHLQVCEEAKCPNIGECWGGGEEGTATATIMVQLCSKLAIIQPLKYHYVHVQYHHHHNNNMQQGTHKLKELLKPCWFQPLKGTTYTCMTIYIWRKSDCADIV